MSEAAPPTPVEPLVRGLKGNVAHGPEKQWDKVGRSVPVQITAPIEVVQWLRSNGYVLSRVFQEAASRLMGGIELVQLERQLEFHREQVTILEAARATLGARKDAEAAVEDAQKARLEALRGVADSFYSQERDDPRRFGKVHNLNWLKARVDGTPALKGSKPEELLRLVLGLRPDYRTTDGAT